MPPQGGADMGLPFEPKAMVTPDYLDDGVVSFLGGF